MPDICSVHGVPFKVFPAGISKTTGKPYASFAKCPVKNPDGTFCSEKAPKQAPQQYAAPQPQANSFQASVVMGRLEAKLDKVLALLEAKKIEDQINSGLTSAIQTDTTDPNSIPF